MILGKVNAFKQAVISLEWQGPSGQTATIDAVIDTGYDGYLTVTPDLATRLQLPFRETRTYELGSGDLVDFPIHDATVLWNGQAQNIATLVTAGGVLVGMSLLTGYTLFIDAVDGGEVRIEARP
jgi:clan AA aspartic protease